MTFWSVAPSQGRRTRLEPAFAESDDDPDHRRGDGEADADAAARTREDGRVDADEPAFHVDEGSARIAGIDGGVRLDEGLEIRHSDIGAGKRRNDARGNGLPDAEGIADGEDEVPDGEVVMVREGQRRQRLLHALQPQDGEVRARIAQHDVRGELPLVVQGHLDLGRIGDDMVVGYDEPVALDDHARAQRPLHALPGDRGATSEELLEEGIVEDGAGLRAFDALGIDVDDGRDGAPDDRRIGKANGLRGGRHEPGGLLGRGGNGPGEKEGGKANASHREFSGRRCAGYIRRNGMRKGRSRRADGGLSWPGLTRPPRRQTNWFTQRTRRKETLRGCRSPA